MTDIDISKIKVGDVVGVRVIRAVVLIPCVHSGSVTVADGWGGEAIINPSAIVSHTPASRPALKVGDRVVNPNGGRAWDIVFIQNTGHGYAHFAHKPDNALWPMRLDEVEQWERV